MTRTSLPAVTARGPDDHDRIRRRGLLLAALLVAAVGVLYIGWLTASLFVFTEARPFQLEPHALDLVRLVILPEPAYGESRQLGILSFDLTGSACGVSAGCTNAATAIIVAIAAIAVLIHARQLLPSTRVATAVALLWIISGPVLVTAFWQSSRFHLLSTTAILLIATWWWSELGRSHMTPRRAGGFIVGSVVAMVVAFNLQEMAYLLVPLLGLLAVVRGARIGAVRGNLLMVAIPLLYGCWYVFYAVNHVDASYAAFSGGQEPLQGATKLLNAMLGTSGPFAFVAQGGDDWAERRRLLSLSLGLLAVLGVSGLLGWLVLTLRRAGTRNLRLLRRWDRELYLLALFAMPLAAGSRSSGAVGSYVLLSQFALITLVALLLRRIARTGRRWHAWASVTAATGVVAALLAAATLIAPGSTYQQLVTDSASIRRVGATIAEALDGRPVASIRWRTLEVPPTAFYVLRGKGLPNQVGEDLWPYLVNDRAARPPVEVLETGDGPELRAQASTLSADGAALIVIDKAYQLRLLAYDGAVLVDRVEEPEPVAPA